MKKPIQKLLAVATFVGATATAAIAAPRTLANGAPAPGNTVAKGESYSRELPERRAERAVNEARRALAAAYNEERAAVEALVESPRVLASGAPACGNTSGKPPPCDEKIANRLVTMRVERLTNAGRAIDAARARLARAEKVLATYKPAAPTSVAMEGTP